MGRFGSGRFGAVRWFGRGSGEGSGSGSGNKVLGPGQGSGKVSGKKVCGRRKAAGKVAVRGGFLEGKVPDKVPEDFGKGSETEGGHLRLHVLVACASICRAKKVFQFARP